MKIVRAEVMGMCFGVRDALKIIQKIADPQSVTIHGQLVHNETVLVQLDASGFAMTDESSRQEVPETPVVLITAHGVSDRERSRLADAGKRIVDTTCPLVTRVHQAALNLQKQGYFVVLIGRRGHVEVQGIIEDLERFDVVSTEDEVKRYPADRLGIICQTTAPARTVERIREAIARHNPDAEIRFVDTVCLPTKEHQRSLERLIEQVDAMVVVGGSNSNNTRELAKLCQERGIPSIHVQGPNDLDPEWLSRFENVGLTAGTSTLDSTIDEVHQAMLQMTVNVEA
ncbi:4-hydroxy-3-methylbut-2-enyl diphosphate reductase [Singulisphaera sp. GP187]|uniref:4-hydroxy-3-methylbut-2-enyl diphosphate reductase n=1 Tax=Singulisphaera sp. GP187 TaxID=1882752 RepID=UPI00092C772D|nr:4-hydroxy-3-methylbut-2-enyl diphosphate reductase [Singulisphaera sp. GP187]SIN90200.1 4-hydroxy-3-methylbut-2-enyl diphosphate reductase [Singulisphaera sp. GP187]